MTGYGKATVSKTKFSVDVELKSINSRHLEIFLKFPQILSSREYEIRELVRSKIKRGKINVFIQLKTDGIENGVPVIHKDKLKSYVKLLKDIQKSAKINNDLKLEHLLNNKEILTTTELDLKETDFVLVKQALNKAIANLQKMKKNEGIELLKDLTKRIALIEKKLNVIQKEFKKSVKDYFNKLKDRVNELVQSADINEDRLNMELAFIADRTDITEECVRLNSHLKFFKESMRKEREPGRKLTFICQELNRETNTISSKSVSTAITHEAVLIKEEIEKIREQIQNIE